MCVYILGEQSSCKHGNTSSNIDSLKKYYDSKYRVNTSNSTTATATVTITLLKNYSQLYIYNSVGSNHLQATYTAVTNIVICSRNQRLGRRSSHSLFH